MADPAYIPSGELVNRSDPVGIASNPAIQPIYLSNPPNPAKGWEGWGYLEANDARTALSSRTMADAARAPVTFVPDARE